MDPYILPVYTTEGLEIRERFGVLDMFEALVLQRFRGPKRSPEITIPVEVDEARRNQRAQEAAAAQQREADLRRRRDEFVRQHPWDPRVLAMLRAQAMQEQFRRAQGTFQGTSSTSSKTSYFFRTS